MLCIENKETKNLGTIFLIWAFGKRKLLPSLVENSYRCTRSLMISCASKHIFLLLSENNLFKSKEDHVLGFSGTETNCTAEDHKIRKTMISGI